MTASTLTKPQPIQCQNCLSFYKKPPRPRLTSKSVNLWGGMPAEDCARAIGWRVWSGTTLGGSEARAVFCPRCAGHQPEAEEVAAPKWDARCNTCDAQARDDYDYAGEPFSEADARRWKDDHRCEPDVEIIAPKKAAT